MTGILAFDILTCWRILHMSLVLLFGLIVFATIAKDYVKNWKYGGSFIVLYLSRVIEIKLSSRTKQGMQYMKQNMFILKSPFLGNVLQFI